MKIQNGFALPTVMIASVVMLTVLLSGLVAASSSNSAIRSQYATKLAQSAAEAGGAMAEACLKKNNYSASAWTAPLGPNTECTGAQVTACPNPASGSPIAIESRCGLVETQRLRSTFSVSLLSGSGAQRSYTVTGTIYSFRSSTRSFQTSDQYQIINSVVFKHNPAASRPTKRFWLFGNKAGLDFQTGGIVASVTSNCTTAQSSLAGEGTTVISTRSGNLQFWTDGRTIWNRNCDVMTDTAGQLTSNPPPAGLNANPSTTQAAAVFPLGTDEARYVIVTNNTENGTNNTGELYYSIVDMTLNGGLGQVLAANKNAQVWPGTIDYSSEALAAAARPDGSGFWVMTYRPYTTEMIVFPFSNSGVPGAPIAQPANSISPTNYSGLGGFGTLNFDSTYSRLVMMAGDHCLSGSCTTREGIVRLMSFNSSTGQVTYLNNWSSYPEGAGYSADFSPSGAYVYTSAIYPGRLARFTVTSGFSDAQIKSSQAFYGTTQPDTPSSCTGGGQILKAPDDKMYIANCGTNFISVLNTPDAANPGYVRSAINLGTGVSYYGLPQAVTI